MPRYSFEISQGKFLNAPSAHELPDDAAALSEALKIWGDLARDIACELRLNPDWQMNVEDESGNVIFIIRAVLETIPRPPRKPRAG